MACHDSTEPGDQSEDPQYHECSMQSCHPLRLDENEPHPCRATKRQARAYSDAADGRGTASAVRGTRSSRSDPSVAGCPDGNASWRVAGHPVARHRFSEVDVEHPEIDLAAAPGSGEDGRE